MGEHGWTARFGEAVAGVAAQRIDSLRAIESIDQYLDWLDALVRWAPREAGDSQQVHDKLVEFHFFVQQPSLSDLQSRIAPGEPGGALTPLSAWIVDFARSWGAYLDTPASAVHIDSFRTNPKFRWDDYMAPPSGYRTFNQFFARHVKPGRRPVADPCHDDIVVAPADASFAGQWPIDGESSIRVDDAKLSLKGLRWSIRQLLEGSPYADAFAHGTATHSALRTFDYHRFHAPLAGQVLEARIIEGQAWLGVDVIDQAPSSGRPARRTLEAEEGTGYQFIQTRALVILRTAHGLVACIPVGMAQVSSVVLTAEPDVDLRKGEELGYFQFGGSDFVMLFAPECTVDLEGVKGRHAMQGTRAGRCRGPACERGPQPS